MTDRHSSGSRDAADGRAPRLSPPPKVAASSASTRLSPAANGSGGRARYWLTTTLFLALGAVALGVFFYLPRWVEARSAATAEEPAFESSVDEPTPPAATSATVAIESPRVPIEMTAEARSGEITPAETRSGETAPPAREPAPRSRPIEPTAVAGASELESSPVRSSDPTKTAFARDMAEGLSGLEHGELESARRAFESALTLVPDSTAATDGLASVEAAELSIAVSDHRQRAGTFEANEDWGAATAEYAAVLALDPTIRFARQGEARASQRYELERGLERHLESTDRLASEAVLDEARLLLERAREIEARGPKLAGQIERLEREIAVASTPVRIVLLSDGMTDVLVYRVGRLGTFERRELDLRPGTYTVVGARAGYRDVRHQLQVSPDGTTTSLTIRCEEKI